MSAARSASPRSKIPYDHDAWKALHAELGKPDYTPDFNAAIEAFLMMTDIALPERLYALVKLQATGNQHGFAVHTDIRTKPFTEADCARRLGATRQQINKAAAKLVNRLQLRIVEGRLYPVADPVAELERRKLEKPGHGIDSSSPNVRLIWQRFKQQFFAEFPDDLKEIREAWQSIEAIKRKREKYCQQKLEEYLASQAQPSAPVSENGSDTGQTRGSEAEERGGHENGDGVDNSGDPLRTPEAPILYGVSDDLKRVSEWHPPASDGEEEPPTHSQTTKIEEALAELGFPVNSSDPVVTDFCELANMHGIPVRSVIRAMMAKLDEKQRKGMKVFNAGALRDFVRKDIVTWISQNGREIESDFKWEESESHAKAQKAGQR